MDQLWEKVLAAIQVRIEEQTYKSWFKPIQVHRIEQGSIYLRVSNQFFKDWLVEKYFDLISDEVSIQSNQEITKVVILTPDESAPSMVPSASSIPKPMEAPPPPIPPTPNSLGADLKADPKKFFADFSENSKVQTLFGEMETPAPSKEKELPFKTEQKSILPDSKKISSKTSFFNIPFNRKYTFSNFVAGPSNNFATMAARAVAEKPASTYNPLFIYGKSGLGKTHLLHAIGIQLRDQHHFKNIIFKSAERFVNELISCLRHQKMNEFHSNYRHCDALLIDDIQLIKGKETTQEEFFHTFNALQQNNKQIIITSDQIPESIPKIDDRLRSRFKGGLIADIQPPDLEHRMAILSQKTEQNNLQLSHEVIEYIAVNIKANVRELEGALNRLIAYKSLTGNPISIETVIEVLKNLIPEAQQPRITVDLIQRTVATFYSIKISELKSDTKAKNIALPRQIAMYLCSVKKIKKQLSKESEFLHTINIIKRQITES